MAVTDGHVKMLFKRMDGLVDERQRILFIVLFDPRSMFWPELAKLRVFLEAAAQAIFFPAFDPPVDGLRSLS